jgi:hypothetical protein
MLYPNCHLSPLRYVIQYNTSIRRLCQERTERHLLHECLSNSITKTSDADARSRGWIPWLPLYKLLKLIHSYSHTSSHTIRQI